MVRLLVLVLPLMSFLPEAGAQEAIATERWFEVDAGTFHVYSQLSRRDSERMAMELERWREAALALLAPAGESGPYPIPTYVYLFDEEDTFQLFADGEEASYFYPSPRAGFLIAVDTDQSLDLAKHHYAHFLINNRPIGLPFWYEEGMANYLSRLRVNSDGAVLREFREVEYEFAASLNNALSLEDLLYDTSALASPRLLQIANLEAAMLVHFILHGHERGDFTDRREQLQNYLAFLQDGRTERFAYDQSFDVPLATLEQEYARYIEAAATDRGDDLVLMDMVERSASAAAESTPDDMTLALAELSLHSGKFDAAEVLFGELVTRQSQVGRAYAGLADAQRLRLRGPDDNAPDVVPLYLQALDMEEEDAQLHLDYGQYLDTELDDCERGYSPPERQRMQEEMRTSFGRALALAPESPEANLSYAQIFLLSGEDWEQGLAYQSKAFRAMPADGFIMEQAIEYSLAAGRYGEARTLIDRLARPLHFWGTPEWIADLNNKLRAAERGQTYDPCAATGL